jgi:hypothetical protein
VACSCLRWYLDQLESEPLWWTPLFLLQLADCKERAA